MGLPQINFQPSQIALIRRTVAKDANENEFNLYMEMCKARGLNPLLRHCYCLVMHKDKADKRQMVIVVSIDGQRHIAERSGCYRPDEQAPRFVVDAAAKDVATNPAGLVSAEVSVYKFSHGQWFPVPGVAYWEESAPIKETWDAGKPSGRFELDKKKDNWRRMPRLMLAKVAEMAALRRAFPDDFSGLYCEAEMDRGEVLDITPNEQAEQAEQADRIAKIGGPSLITDWLNGKELEAVPVGQFFDRAAAFIDTCKDEPGTVMAWRDRNRHALQQFWGIAKNDALELKKLIETASAAPAVANGHDVNHNDPMFAQVMA